MTLPKDPKPEGFIFKSIPKSPREAFAQTSQSRVTSTTKGAIQYYLEQFFNSNGIYRNQLKTTASYSLQYETNLTVPSNNSNPSVYEVQLARFYSQLKQKFPCIIIEDTGFDYINPGLGGIYSSRVNGPKTSTLIMKLDCNLPLKLVIAALDETTCQDIRDLLLYIFGPLTSFNRSYLLKSQRPEDSWEVRLPTQFDSSEIGHHAITDDKKDVFWMSDISFTVEFEGTIDICFDRQVQEGLYELHEQHEGEIPGGLVNVDGSWETDPGWLTRTVRVPEKVTLGVPSFIDAPFVEATSYFTSDDSRVAIVDGCKIFPVKLGTFNVYLMDKIHGQLLQQWSVKVV
jgi:hypothetical protein